MHRVARALLCVALVLPLLVLDSATPAAAAAVPGQWVPLVLQNGWVDSPFATNSAAVTTISGVVTFRGAIANGTNTRPFILPAAYRPTTDVYLPVDLCNAANGRLLIQPDGTVTVQAENTFADAQCFTSLDGASFAPNATGYKALTLTNGWTNAPFATSNAAAKVIAGVVHLKGAIANGTTTTPFTLPAAYRPTTDVYVPVDLCNATNGRLLIKPNGTVTIQAENTFTNAQCFTSLDGVTYSLTPTGYTNLALVNGWKHAPFSTSKAAAKLITGEVHFKGAVASGTSSTLFTLPAALRPVSDVYVPIDLCNATDGRLQIRPDGTVTVQSQTNFANAQCFTSLDGASFAKPSFVPLVLQNGWVDSPFATNSAAVTTISGVVTFRGAIANGTNTRPFILPAAYRPTTDVYLPVDLCNAANGRLLIQPDGTVTVQAENTFADAQCFTSLDGASFAPNATGYKALTLTNGWTNAPFATSNAAAKVIAGVVHLKGAIANGTTTTPFTLPAAYRPTTDVYVPVDLCNATNGRLLIKPNGTVTIQAENTFTNAQCFTSLDGVTYSLTPTGYTNLALVNGWKHAPFSTSKAAAKLITGEVHFKGAVASGTSSTLFTLPAALRPVSDVYVPIDLCNATDGRLQIRPDGTVTVQSQTNFTNAQCFTSLDGASFTLPK